MNNEKELDRVLQEIIARWGIPGLGVGIVKNGQIAYAHGFGVQSLESRAPVTPDSFFCIASITKCFVATAVMQLVEQGRLDLYVFPKRQRLYIITGKKIFTIGRPPPGGSHAPPGAGHPAGPGGRLGNVE